MLGKTTVSQCDDQQSVFNILPFCAQTVCLPKLVYLPEVSLWAKTVSYIKVKVPSAGQLCGSSVIHDLRASEWIKLEADSHVPESQISYLPAKQS